MKTDEYKKRWRWGQGRMEKEKQKIQMFTYAWVGTHTYLLRGPQSKATHSNEQT